MTQTPIHPGEHLKEEMSELGMSAADTGEGKTFSGTASFWFGSTFGSIGPASPVLGQRSRIVQTDPFGLVDQPLQLGPLSFGNRTLIILIKQVGYSGLRYRVQLQKTPARVFPTRSIRLSRYPEPSR